MRARVFRFGFGCHPQTIEVVQTRAEPLGIEVRSGTSRRFDFQGNAGIFLPRCFNTPRRTAAIRDYSRAIEQLHAAGALAIVAADILALTLLKPPGEFGADVAVGSTQRFGVPLGFGGPHADFSRRATRSSGTCPGRLVGVSRDAEGNPGFRLSLQTREQHIRREKATSNICTAQVLLAVMASMYAVYHGPEGLKRIAERVPPAGRLLAAACGSWGTTSARRRSSTPSA